MLGWIGLGKLEAVARCGPVAHGTEDGHMPNAQRKIQLHDFPNREFDRQCG